MMDSFEDMNESNYLKKKTQQKHENIFLCNADLRYIYIFFQFLNSPIRQLRHKRFRKFSNLASDWLAAHLLDTDQLTWIFFLDGRLPQSHYTDVIIGTIASQITSLTIVYSSVYSDADQRKNQSSASLAFVRGLHRRPVNSSHKRPVTRKMFPFDDVIMIIYFLQLPTVPDRLVQDTWWTLNRLGTV